MLLFKILNDIGCTACRVRAHGIESGTGIRAKYGFSYDLMLNYRSLQAVAGIEKRPGSERREPLPKVCCKRMQVSISSTHVNRMMKTFVEIRVTIRVAIENRLLGTTVNKLDLHLFRHSRAECAQLGAKPLHLASCLKQVKQPGKINA